MPTLVRLLTVLALIAGVVVAIMAALVAFVEPRQGTIRFDVPVPALQKTEGQAPAPVAEAAP